MKVEKRGYVVWAIAGAIFAVPEIWASVDSSLPFPTLSSTVGHLERKWEIMLGVILVIAYALMHAVRLGIANVTEELQEEIAQLQAELRGAEVVASRTVPTQSAATRTVPSPLRGDSKRLAIEQGRLTRTSTPRYATGLWWGLYLPSTLVIVALGFLIPLWIHGWEATPAEKQLAGELGYAAMGLMFFLIPGLLSYFPGVLVPFPGLFTTVVNIEKRVPIFAVIVVGCMTFLMLHLVFYPYPKIIKWFPDLEHVNTYCAQNPDAPICIAKKP
jgi:hypothetical protein